MTKSELDALVERISAGKTTAKDADVVLNLAQGCMLAQQLVATLYRAYQHANILVVSDTAEESAKGGK